MRALYLFSEYYPYGDDSMSEHAFLKNEIRYLTEKFDKVVVVPSLLLSPPPQETTYEVDPSLGSMLQDATKLKIFTYAITNKYLYREMLSRPVSFWDLGKLKRLVYFTGRAGLVKGWVEERLNKTTLPLNTLFYSFWLTEMTLGLISVKGIRVISRAHGHDLYEDYHGYMPSQYLIIKSLQNIYLACEHAKHYLESKYPGVRNKIQKNYLGVKRASAVSKSANNKIVHIASCSYLRPVKRVHLIYAGVMAYVKTYNASIHWTHFGDGIEMNRIQKLCFSTPDSRFQFSLRGRTPNHEVISFYAKEPVDIFIHLSESEGGVPVAIQEAQAHGVPVIGTRIGGIPEIVNADVGVLLKENPTPAEIADAIHYIASDTSRFHQMRENSVKNWHDNFNEEINAKRFANEIWSLKN